MPLICFPLYPSIFPFIHYPFYLTLLRTLLFPCCSSDFLGKDREFIFIPFIVKILCLTFAACSGLIPDKVNYWII